MGNNTLRTALLVAVLLCGQALTLVHAFDHPVAAAHADHACPSCGHGHFGSAPPREALDLAVITGAREPAAYGRSFPGHPDCRMAPPSRGPPPVLV